MSIHHIDHRPVWASTSYLCSAGCADKLFSFLCVLSRRGFVVVVVIFVCLCSIVCVCDWQFKPCMCAVPGSAEQLQHSHYLPLQGTQVPHQGHGHCQEWRAYQQQQEKEKDDDQSERLCCCLKGHQTLKKLQWSGIKNNYTQQFVSQFLISFVKNSTFESCLLKIYIWKLWRHDCECWHSVPKMYIIDVINKVVMHAFLTGVVLKGLTLWKFVFNICVYA